MIGRLRGVSTHRRHVLCRGWELLRTPPGFASRAEELGDGDWVSVGSVGTVAHCELEAGRWSLNATSRACFDADDWWYRVRFDIPAEPESGEVVLGFEGLATLCEVWLNGVFLLRSENMFVAIEVPVTEQLRQSANDLVLCFRSLEAALTVKRPRPSWRVPMLTQQQLRWHRTSLLGRTPGWSPPAPPVGPWRDVWLEARDAVDVMSHRMHSSLEYGRGVIALGLVLSAARTIRSVSAVVQRGDVTHESRLLSDDGHSWRGAVHVENPQLWWPHTHGTPTLYSVKLRIAVSEIDVEVDLGKTGFRSIEIGTLGGDFSIKVNGVDVFCRGACWMPLDLASLRATPEQMADAVEQVCHAGMNMIRVTGLTTYEEDAFYDECDRKGVLVWHDFMFANMDYPLGDQAFRCSVEIEVEQQTARWQGRPCIAIVCGNSEVSQQAAMWGAPRDQWEQEFFTSTLATWVSHALPGVPYWPSSAWGGAFPHQVNAGTVSYYGVGAYLRVPEDARLSGLRFATECLALANVPVPASVDALADGNPLRVTHARWKERAPRDLTAGWDFEDVRDHYMCHLFAVNPTRLRYVDHDRYLHFARATSREIMVATFSQWRAAGSSCRGALVLSLRDLWTGAGWGLIDALGRPKSCYWGLRQALQPLAVLLTDEGCNGVVVHVANDREAPVRIHLKLEVWRRDALLVTGERDLTVDGRCTLKLPAVGLLDQFLDLTNAYRFGPLAHDCLVVTARRDDGSVIDEAFHFPSGASVERLEDPGLRAAASGPDEAGNMTLTVSAATLAVAVCIEAHGYLADDDCFHLAPGQKRLLRLRSLDGRSRLQRGVVSALNSRAPTVISIAG